MRTFKTIHIPIPQNLPERYKKLFEKKSTYKVPELGVKEYSNVFVSHEGLCLQNFRLVPYSSFNICTKYDKSYIWQYCAHPIEENQWVQAAITTKSNYTITGLTSIAKYWFRAAYISAEGQSDWSDPVSEVVK